MLAWLKAGNLDATQFADWVRRSFSHTGEEARAERLLCPVIYYDPAGFRVPYSFVFDANHSEVLIWHWEVRVFRGQASEAHDWLMRGPRSEEEP